MLLLVDTIRVDPDHAHAYLELIASAGEPVMRDAGASLASCTSTARDLGEDVEILIVWSIGDHARWNEIRKNLVLDPRWDRYARDAARLRRGGTRRFHHATSLTPGGIGA